ncbi:MAG: ABC transporter permease [Cryobacterium sp.]|nr:ABC transporter permease [Cryobacterium sp.]MBX3090262.1 ABC transporter permease [Cryobacterium sp.]MCO5293608.1 ABC transporter permease [Homoserinimonas sp.]MCW5944695.1 ABC transporter permease [Cryobacterium sp.]
MVARFLKLKLRLLGNLFRRSPWQIFGLVVGFSYGVGTAVAAAAGLIALRLAPVELARDVVVSAGSLIVLGFLLVPLVFGADDTLDPRSFSLFGIPTSKLSLGLAAAALIGVPALAITLVAIAQVVTWTRDAGTVLVALISMVLIVATCILGARVTTSIAALLLSSRRAREVTGLTSLLVLSAIAPLVALAVTVDWAKDGLRVLNGLAGVLAFTPLGAVWAAPAAAAGGNAGLAILFLFIAAAFLAVLWFAWSFVVSRMLVTPERVSRERPHAGLGWFGLVPGNQAGAIAARSLSYWGRDARYRASLVIVPVIPAVMMAALYPAGVPFHVLVLLPVPIMCFFIAWSTVHNDVAFDNTAIWLHVASNIRGWADRLGRIVPPLLLGIFVIALGTPLTVWGYGSADVAPALIGMSSCVLLVGLGLSSVISAAFPYPAVHPGAGPFAQPQSSAGGASWVQGLSFFAVLGISIPSVWLAVLALQRGGGYSVAALLVGLAIGLAAIIAGVYFGGKVFERRGPELLAFTARY